MFDAAFTEWLTLATSIEEESHAVIEQDGRTYLVSVMPYVDEEGV